MAQLLKRNRILNRNRINWIDVGKGVGIFLVVLAHVYKHNPVREWIYSYHMPLFFFLSGYVFDLHKYSIGVFLKRRIDSLVIPFFMFASLSYAYWFFVARRFRSQDLDALTPVFGFLYGNVGVGMDPNRSLWFLTCLFVTSMMFYVIVKYIKDWKAVAGVLFLSAVMGYLSPMKGWLLPWGIDAAFTGIVFYGMGYLIKEKWGTVINDIKPYSIKIMAIGLILFGINLTASYLNGNIVWGPPFIIKNNVFLYYIAAFTGVAACVLLIRSFKFPGFVVFLGMNSIVIMFLHQHIKRILIKSISVVTHLPDSIIIDSHLGSILVTLLIITVCLPFIYFFNRYGPSRFGYVNQVKK